MNYDKFAGKTKNLNCPNCKKKKWKYDCAKKMVAFLAENKDGLVDITGTTPAVNLGLLECKNCGYVVLFSELTWEDKNEQR